MIRVRQAVVVEGKYDKIRLSNVLDTLILPTNGFRIFRNREQVALLRALAKTRGLIVMTDSDAAGFQIRAYLNNVIGEGDVTNVYVPQIAGRERRKEKPSAQGFLGVEGLDDDVLLAALSAAGVTADKRPPDPDPVTKADLYEDGFLGTPDAVKRREALCRALGLPTGLNTNTLPTVIADLCGRAEYDRAVEQISAGSKKTT